MKSPDPRYLLPVCIALIAGGWWLSASPYSPMNAHKKERPVLKLLAKVAKVGLWFVFVAENHHVHDDEHVAKTSIDEDGHRVLDHSRGW